MKKLLAVLLSLMLLCPTAVFADTADLFTLSEPVLTIGMGGEESTIDLTGLKIAIAIPDEEGNTCAINVLGKDEVLFSGIMKLDGDKVLLTAEGLSNTYYIDKPDVEVNPDNLEDAEIDLSGIDMDGLMNKLMESVEFNADEDGNMTFFVPHTALNEVLADLLPILDQVPEAALPAESKDEAVSFINGLKDSDSGIDISGSLTGSDTGMDFQADVLMVDNGQAAEQPILSLAGSMTAADDGAMSFQISVSAAADESGELTEVASIDLQIGDNFSFHAVILGSYEASFSYQPADSIAEIGLTMDGMSYRLSVKVGTETGDISICPVGDAASAINANELTEEQSEQLMNELMTAASGLFAFFTPDTEEAADDAA